MADYSQNEPRYAETIRRISYAAYDQQRSAKEDKKLKEIAQQLKVKNEQKT